MIIKGRCRGNGIQLANYLLHSTENDRAEVLAIIGTATPHDLKRSLLEMSLTSEMTGRTDAGLYHTQISPRDHEAAVMTLEQKLRAVEILAEHLGLQGQKCVIVEHKKDGRMHLHAAWERYDHNTGTMWDDEQNYARHTAAARAMEIEFGQQLTHEKKNHLDQTIKAHILNLWNDHQDPTDFIKAMDKAGFEVTQGIDKRPYQIVDQYGTVHDLTRQLKGVRQADVSERLHAVRRDLRKTPKASQESRRDQQHTVEPEQLAKCQSDNLRELSDSQDMAEAMINLYKQKVEPEKEKSKSYSYSFTFRLAPALPLYPVPKIQSDNLHELSDSQDLAVAMIEHHRQRSAAHQHPLTRPQMDAANDNLSDIEKLKLQQQQARARGHRRGGYKR